MTSIAQDLQRVKNAAQEAHAEGNAVPVKLDLLRKAHKKALDLAQKLKARIEDDELLSDDERDRFLKEVSIIIAHSKLGEKLNR